MSIVYILQSQRKDRYYIGSTSDLHRRLEEHNRGQTKSTRSGRPWDCVFQIENPNAAGIESRIKRCKSKKVIDQIVQDQSLDCLK